MANRTIGMEVFEQIKLMNDLGIGKKAIARQLGISKNTVKEYLFKQLEVQPQIEVVPNRLTELQSFFPYRIFPYSHILIP